MLQIAGNCALRQKHKDKQIRTQLAKTRTKESTAFRFGSSQVIIIIIITIIVVIIITIIIIIIIVII